MADGRVNTSYMVQKRLPYWCAYKKIASELLFDERKRGMVLGRYAVLAIFGWRGWRRI